VLFEDELHDNGVAHCSAKVRTPNYSIKYAAFTEIQYST
jgi:hypothetical protein